MLRRTILLIYVSILLALIFTPAVQKIQRLRLWHWSPGRGLAVLILSGIAGVVVASVAFLMLPPIVRDTQGFVQDLPSQLQQLSRHIQTLPFGRFFARHLNPDILTRYVDSFFQHGLDVLQSLAGGLFEASILVILTIYFILDGPRSFEWAMSLVAASRRDRLRETLLRAQQRVQKWLAGQVLLMVILGSSTALVLGLLHVRYFYALAVFAGVANFIPVVGPVATVVLAGTVAAFDSWLKLLGVIAFYLIYQQVENAYLSPRIMQATVGLPGVAVIVALVVGGALAGVLGALVAVPTAALMATIIDEYFVGRTPGPAHSEP
ncbi:MAG: AI-2E family transporter [Terriglobales bacterium]